MTALIIQALILVLSIILFAILVSWIGSRNSDKFIEKMVSRKEDHIEQVIDLVMDKYKTGPWYLVVYTQGVKGPIWISNNNIRSIHPDAQNHKLIVKQFQGEDMAIENVENYELCAANELCEYVM